MIRKIALLIGAGYLAKKWLDRSPRDASAEAGRGVAAQPGPGHAPTDLSGATHPDGSARAEEHYRPDPTAPVPPEDRESLRPVTAPAPHDPPGR
ncbi:MAG TPA: hypothetical protein VJQ78_06845 [Sphingobium sp.]|nr:hypothetical protein [Sphingobium sp.]